MPKLFYFFRVFAAVLSFMASIFSQGMPAFAAEAVSRYWRIVASSEFIVVATPNLPIEAQTAGGGQYLNVPLAIDAVLKGGTLPLPSMRYFNQDNSYNVPEGKLKSLDGRRAIFFLVRGPGALYFPNMGPSALQPADTSLIAEVKSEIDRQKAVADSWRPHLDAPHRAEVQSLIELLLGPATQDSAVHELDAIAAGALVAIVDSMDDRRRLAHPHVTFENKSPNAFEGLAHYGPKLIVDTCVGILNHTTGVGFFPWLVNGGDEKERQVAVSAWRVYADMVLNHLNELAPPN